MTVLQCLKPGAKAGQIILAVDLSVAGNTDKVLEAIDGMGYKPQIRHVAYPTGVHVLAFLKDEFHDESVDDDYLLEEWLLVRDRIEPDAVHLWRGKNRQPNDT